MARVYLQHNDRGEMMLSEEAGLVLVGPSRPRACYGFILREGRAPEDLEQGQICCGSRVTLTVGSEGSP